VVDVVHFACGDAGFLTGYSLFRVARTCIVVLIESAPG